MSKCRLCHEVFTEECEKHVLFWFSCKKCVKRAKSKADWHRKRKTKRGGFSATDWLVCLLEHEFRCCSCGEKKPNLTIDHEISLNLGGKNESNNLKPL